MYIWNGLALFEEIESSRSAQIQSEFMWASKVIESLRHIEVFQEAVFTYDWQAANSETTRQSRLG
ncbi:MAG: hypothetical protein C4K47_06215 [Candidatus Thorarchaeota archaeon]|nr:MAG: hypothetical protein C4K47_06215 [Candidatus Thorarchaeota archaeon]